MSKKKVWYLAGPFYRYEQDVKAEAAKAGVRVIDANVTDDRTDAADEKELPRVTLKPEYRPAKPAKVEKTGGKQPTPEEIAAAQAAAAALGNGSPQQ